MPIWQRFRPAARAAICAIVAVNDRLSADGLDGGDQSPADAVVDVRTETPVRSAEGRKQRDRSLVRARPGAGGVCVAEDLAVTFTGFVISLMTTAAVHFGDYPDPVTGEKKPLNLEGASQMIEILGMLEQKTRGNLTAQERSMLDQVLYDLRMRYVAAQQTVGATDVKPSDPS